MPNRSNYNNLPLLIVPEKKEEIKSWVEQIIGYMTHYAQVPRSFNNYNDLEDNYRFYHGIINPSDYQYVTHTWGDTVPSEIQHYYLLNSKIERMAGEILSTPQKFSVETINTDAVSRKLNRLATAVAEAQTGQWNRELEKHLGVPLELEDKAIALPAQLEQMSIQDFREMNEEAIFDGLQYLFYDYTSQLESQLKRCFYDQAIVSAEFGEVMIRNGNPHFERVDPRELAILSLGNMENLEASDVILRKYHMPLNTFIMQFGAQMKEQNNYEAFTQQINALQQNLHTTNETHPEQDFTIDGIYYRNAGMGIEILVRKIYFKAIRQKKVKVINPEYLKNGQPTADYDETKGERYEPVSDDYQPKSNEYLKKIPVAEPWMAVMGGDNYVVSFGKITGMPRREGNYANVDLPIIGQIRYAPSIVQIGKHLGKLCNIIFFHIQKAINIAGSKALIIDVSKLPEGYDQARVIYEAKGMGIIFIDSTQVKGTPNPDSYKHLQQVDLGLDDNVTKLISLVVAIENIFNRLTGINDFWTGFVKPDTAGVTMQQGAFASSQATQSVFYSHTKFVEQVLNRLANLMPRCWSRKQQMSYVLGDKGLKVFQTHEGLANDQYGVFVANNYKDAQDKKFIMELGMKALGASPAMLLDLIRIYYADSPAHAEAILSQGLKAMEEIRLKLEQQSNEIAAMKVNVDQFKAQVPIAVAKINAEKDMSVAQLNNAVKKEIKEGDVRFKEDKIDVEHAQEMRSPK